MEQFCEIILKLDQRFRRRFQEEIPFKDTICTILVEGIKRKNPVK